ncbi:class I SAM-dependent methyltransferase [Stenotrophomonas sp. S39]|uniref:class I SAM-dependent methyltransferase n=1 Tax=Stenotrophomonas sp. S39 TaxID=2767451 RepID=UPI00190A437E|nr:class I SAM-dependent methyltransferase [Stenotrophomonas sp. S39]MBK0052708.1 class I SAM-dependent methyltransferase [Stenotrophomonas sp. S39]
MVKRTRPRIVVELGTGFGVTAARMAGALLENSSGVIHTYDNGSHFSSEPGIRFVEGLKGPLADSLREMGQNYPAFLQHVFQWAGGENHVVASWQEIGFAEIAQAPAFDGGIDMVFSDFNHSQDSIQALLAAFLPRMEESASIFIDSASTQRLSYLTHEAVVDALNQNKIPRTFNKNRSEQDIDALLRMVQCSRFRLMHLLEACDRAQNSTAWISIEPVDVIPTAATFLH